MLCFESVKCFTSDTTATHICITGPIDAEMLLLFLSLPLLMPTKVEHLVNDTSAPLVTIKCGAEKRLTVGTLLVCLYMVLNVR